MRTMLEIICSEFERWGYSQKWEFDGNGQLVAVAVSFLLSLNRLYSKSKFIAIDDPVQTIDDINLWGLMETLRHDFRNWFILLSTHEKNYGQLLDYKFRKVGINSEYIDMGDKH